MSRVLGVASQAVRTAGSMKVTTVGLLMLFAIVLAGTLYQANHGIFETKERIIHAWLIWAGPAPLPGGQLTLALLGANLLAGTLTRIPWRWSKVGLFVVHFGLIALIVGGLVQRAAVDESVLTLAEGERSEFSRDPNRWQLVVLEAEADERYSLASLPARISS